ncbi:MAG: anthranilate phosphoribosyltransferase [Ruminococcus sp.]|nr:anthranilate phosphoribosyltransferase [Ruminococcus sp.]
MLKNEISYIAQGKSLSREMTENAFDKIMSGAVNDIQISAFLTALSIKGETIDEITAAATILRKYCLQLPHKSEVLDIVGTGGDKSDSFNISTTSAFVLSAAGIDVAKHGNRAASSKCGAADLIEALGAKLDISAEKSGEILDKTGVCFLFAQKYHSAMKYVGKVRKEIGIKTIFNLVGPLSNPAFPKYQLMGVYSEELLKPLAHSLANIGVKNLMTAYGRDGLDEISLCGETAVYEIIDGKESEYIITPEKLGFDRCSKNNLTGGSPQENAEITLSILNGEKGHKRNAVVLNCIYAYHLVHPEKELLDIKEIIENSIDSGKALNKLNEFLKLTKEEIQ